MAYAALADRLVDAGSPTVTAFPDGSVDRFYRVSETGGRPISSRAEFGRLVDGPSNSFSVDPEGVTAGGQAVNLASQAHELGADVTLYGHLDHPRFDDLPFDAVSMGDPATVFVYEFDDGKLMFAEESADIRSWTLADFRDVADLPRALGADAVCCANWVSFEGLTDAFRSIADLVGDDAPPEPRPGSPRAPAFVFDPGDLTGRDADDVRAMLDALGALDGPYDVAVSANRPELAYLTAAASDDVEPEDAASTDADDRSLVADVRDAAGVSTVVLHGEDAATAATPDGSVAVPTLRVERPQRHAGAGDRFGGGLACALGLGWDWEAALALGNACASYFVETGRTGGRDDLAAFVRERS